MQTTRPNNGHPAYGTFDYTVTYVSAKTGEEHQFRVNTYEAVGLVDSITATSDGRVTVTDDGTAILEDITDGTYTIPNLYTAN